jgi:diguanylate cyclase
MRVLVIEDEPSLREHMLQVLTFEGFEAVGVADGRSGIEAARRTPPDLVICDLMLPGINGLGVCRALRDDPLTCDTATIVVSAHSSMSDREQTKELGVVGYVSKPFRVGEFMEAVQRSLKPLG